MIIETKIRHEDKEYGLAIKLIDKSQLENQLKTYVFSLIATVMELSEGTYEENFSKESGDGQF